MRAPKHKATEAAGLSVDPIHLAALRASGLFMPEWYAVAYAGHVPESGDLLLHFCETGWREGRRPNPYFDSEWYLERHPDVREAGHNPLLHYLLDGEREGRAPGPCFDPAWYRRVNAVDGSVSALAHFLAHRTEGTVSPVEEFDAAYYLAVYPDVAAARVDPFEHYLVQGHREGRNPSAVFNTRFYRDRYLNDSGAQNPLLHYRAHRGDAEIRRTMPDDEPTIPREMRRNTAPGPHFEERRPLPASAVRHAKLLAFYLPQFHPIEENDAWWGRGFTEWTNVARGLPRFADHYQPRIPRDLGPYSLEDPAILRRQIAMAHEAGIDGFIFYFYWFNGRRLLERPLDAFLADDTVDMPFCLMWANENWTRRWDGSDDEVLISQDYRAEDEPGLIAAFVRHFADRRYIRVTGRPLLMIYRPRLIPDTAATVARWRRTFRERHAEDPLFVMAQSFRETDPRPFAMDGAVEFPPHKLVQGLSLKNPGLKYLDPGFSAQVFDYDAVVDASLAERLPDFPLIKTAVPGWDNDPRRQGAGLVLHGATPAKYQDWLAELVRGAMRTPFFGEAFVCINAWNEWAEGAYLEPDVHFGAAYLNATARAVARLDLASGSARILLVGHDAFPSGAQHLLLAIGRQLRRQHGVEVAFLLLAGGKLESDYAAVAPLTIVPDAAALADRIAALRARGFRAAIVNTAAAACAVQPLRQGGVSAVMLVHELPRILREKALIADAAQAAEAAHTVVFPVAAVRDAFLAATHAAPARSIVLPQGLYRPAPFRIALRAALRASLGLAEDELLAVGMGYADLRKGFDLFLQVWRTAQRGSRRRLIHFAWIGGMDPDLREHLSTELAAALASGTFHLLGYRSDGPDWFSAADVHVLTSREDPFPSVALEAMSAGLPTVAFADTGGIPDILRAHAAGSVVPLGDVAAMAEHVLALAAAAAAEGRERLADLAARSFGFGDYVAELLALAHPGNPQVSVVVPNHNYARYLRRRLASIFAQTYPVLEVIVLDDASGDDSIAAAHATAEEWGREIRVVTGAANSGSVFRQWRRAAELARGAWLWIAEADDDAEPKLLEALVQGLAAAPGAVMAFADSRVIDADGSPVSASYKPYYRQCGAATLVTDGVFDGRAFLRRHLAERNLILNASAVLWNREALLAAFERCAADLQQFRMAGDWRLYVELLDQPDTSIVYVAEPLNVHRRHAASVTHQLDAECHIGEIARMQRIVAARLTEDVGLRTRQARVLQEVAEQLGASAPVEPQERRRHLRSVV